MDHQKTNAPIALRVPARDGDDLSIFSEKSIITQRLGLVRIPDGSGEIAGSPAKNTTRWVVDIEQNTERLELELVRPYASSPLPDVLSFVLGPLDRAFWGAHVFVEPLGPLKLALHAEAPCHYLLTVDTVHSLHR